jgi:hypothetical protein
MNATILLQEKIPGPGSQRPESTDIVTLTFNLSNDDTPMFKYA